FYLCCFVVASIELIFREEKTSISGHSGTEAKNGAAQSVAAPAKELICPSALQKAVPSAKSHPLGGSNSCYAVIRDFKDQSLDSCSSY
ncbi:hypothetical protein MXD63_44825, partial [Frankia sp. Cpl3]|nr:hypothetical protein [Frankia sp. Cpl3]